MKYKGMIFDFNGVLLWDTHFHEKAWEEMAKRIRGPSLSSEEIHTHVHGRTNKSILEYLLSRSITNKELSDLSAQKESSYQSMCLQNSTEFKLSPGAVELLEFIMKSNVPYTIATASDGNNLDFFFKHLGLGKWFDRAKIVYDDGSFVGKREMYVKAAKNLSLLPEECIVIEDAQAGIIAAQQAKIGKIVALGPKEKHNLFLQIEGISEIITSLLHFPREALHIVLRD
jgi:beta-phosphoglucomutase-like phosphatase (HAD superfamily)